MLLPWHHACFQAMYTYIDRLSTVEVMGKKKKTMYGFPQILVRPDSFFTTGYQSFSFTVISMVQDM